MQVITRCSFGIALVFISSLQALSALAAPIPDPCSSGLWTQPLDIGGTGLQVLLKPIQIGTRWADLPAATKAELQTRAENRLAAFRVRWGKDALARKEAILLGCATSQMTTSMDDYYRKTYDSVLPATFSLADIKNADFRRALVRSYLGAMAAYRATITYPGKKLPNRDWDGESMFDSVRLPDRQAYEDIKQYNATVLDELKNVKDSSLDETDTSLKREAMFAARALAVGAFTGDSFGGADMETVCEIISLHNDVVQGYRADGGRPKIFASDDEVLREVNAIFLHSTDLRWLDVGTLASATKLTLCRGTDDDLEKFVGLPAKDDIARGIVLLRSWWIERVSSRAAAQNKCSIYSAADRQLFWEAFSADQHFNNDGASSMETYKAQLANYRGTMVARYRSTAKLALEQVFPDGAVLTEDQRAQVRAAIDAESAFGLFPSKIAAALDLAQGTTDGPAATAWKNALATNVATLGGNYADGDSVRPQDEAAIKAMFEEVKIWVADQHQGYPIDISLLYDKFKLRVTTDGGATTSNASGDISFGVGTKRSKMEYYSLLLHELRHAVNGAWGASAPDKSKVTSDAGPAVEGSGVAVEALLLEPFMKQTLKNDLAYSLYAIDFGIRDARFTATTDATLQKFFRNSCVDQSELNTVDFSKAIAVSYGLTGALADTLALRAHIGTQYFQYISGGLQMLDDIGYLQSKIDPSGANLVDPYVLFACGLNNPRRDADYIAALKACMKR